LRDPAFSKRKKRESESSQRREVEVDFSQKLDGLGGLGPVEQRACAKTFFDYFLQLKEKSNNSGGDTVFLVSVPIIW